jgi:hypothetical protein
VGRCWAKSVSGLRAEKKKKSGLRTGLGCGAGLEAACAGRGLIFYFFFKILFPF